MRVCSDILAVLIVKNENKNSKKFQENLKLLIFFKKNIAKIKKKHKKII